MRYYEIPGLEESLVRVDEGWYFDSPDVHWQPAMVIWDEVTRSHWVVSDTERVGTLLRVWVV